MDHEISISGYDLFRKDRSKHGGGVAMYVKEAYNATRLLELECDNIEILWANVNIGNTNVIVSTCYRPPSSSSTVLETNIDIIELALLRNKLTVILGDFNYDYNLSDLNMIEYLCHMKQLILHPTRVTIKSSSVIDHIYTSDETKHKISGVVKMNMSDHYAVFTILSFKQEKFQPRTLTCRNYSNFNIDSFLNDLDNCHPFRNDSDDVLLHSSDVIKLWECWKCDFLQIIHKHAPLKQIRVKTRNNPCCLLSS